MNILKLMAGLIISLLCLSIATVVPGYLPTMGESAISLIQIALFIMAFVSFFAGVIEK